MHDYSDIPNIAKNSSISANRPIIQKYNDYSDYTDYIQCIDYSEYTNYSEYINY